MPAGPQHHKLSSTTSWSPGGFLWRPVCCLLSLVIWPVKVLVVVFKLTWQDVRRLASCWAFSFINWADVTALTLDLENARKNRHINKAADDLPIHDSDHHMATKKTNSLWMESVFPATVGPTGKAFLQWPPLVPSTREGGHWCFYRSLVLYLLFEHFGFIVSLINKTKSMKTKWQQ